MSDPAILRLLGELSGKVAALEALERPRGGSGTWTPIFIGAGTAGTFTYAATRYGTWTRLGDQIFLSGRCAISAITVAPTGAVRIGGLPFTSKAGVYGSLNLVYISNFNYSANALDLGAFVQPADTTAYLTESFDNALAGLVPSVNFTNAACDLIFTGQYTV